MAGSVVLSPEIIIGCLTIICTLFIGGFTIATLRKQTNILSQQTKMLEVYYRPKLIVTQGKIIDNLLPLYECILQNESDIPAYNVRCCFRLVGEKDANPEQLINLMNNFDEVDVFIKSFGVISRIKPATIYVQLPTNIYNAIDDGGLELKLGQHANMFLCGMIQYDNSLQSILICEFVSLDPVISNLWQMQSVSIDPMRLKDFQNTIKPKMNANKIIK